MPNLDPPQDTFIKLIQRFADLWHKGKIPVDRATFVEEVLQEYMPQTSKRIGILSEAEWNAEHIRTKAELTKAADFLAQRDRWAN